MLETSLCWGEEPLKSTGAIDPQKFDEDDEYACITPWVSTPLKFFTENIQLTYKLTPEDRTLLVMPLFHVHGLLAGFLSPLFSGGSVIVPLRFSASEFWANFITHKANWYTAVPTIHQILLRNPPPSQIPKIRFIRSCSSPLSPKTFHELEKAFNAPVLEAYAMTEGAHQMTSNPLPPAKRLPGSVGIGQGVEVKILDQDGREQPQGSEAEICIRGENVTKGYLNNPEANKTSFTADGFFRTGDQGKKDKDGYVIITGRIKELINKGGEKISPVELDNIVAQNQAVAEAVHFAINDDMYGQVVGLAVVLKDGQRIAEDELRTYIASKVAKFKVPTKVKPPLAVHCISADSASRSSSQTSCPRPRRVRFRGEWSRRRCSRKSSQRRSCRQEHHSATAFYLDFSTHNA